MRSYCIAYTAAPAAPAAAAAAAAIRLDDVYGSPDVDDIERFSRALMQVGR
jgi:hypothetical protein